MGSLPKYIFVFLGVIFIGFAVVKTMQVIVFWRAGPAFEIRSENVLQGLFDPTVEYQDEKTGWLAYSAIDVSDESVEPLVSVNISHTHSGGKRFNLSHTVFDSKFDSLSELIDGEEDVRVGVWRYEMPALVYTPEDTGREWKIFAYRYFWDLSGDIELARTTGIIVYKDTSDPTTRTWSDEKWLFSAGNGNPPFPYNKLVLLSLNRLHPSLQDVTAYSDPGAYFKDGMLYLTLSAFTDDANAPDRLVLIGSQDFGQSWGYVGTLFTRDDVKEIEEYTQFSGGQIVEKDGVPYLLVSFGTKSQVANGTFVLAFDDLASGKIRRSQTGSLDIINHFVLDEDITSTMGGGQADYHEYNSEGLFMSVMDTSKIKPFEVVGRGHKLIKK